MSPLFGMFSRKSRDSKESEGPEALEQQEMIEAACPALVGLISQGHEIIVSHGNGPQVGMIHLAFDIASQADAKVAAMLRIRA